MVEEVHLLRREKESLREGIEDLAFEAVQVNDEVAKLRAENAKLRRAATRRTREVKRLQDNIRYSNESLESYKKGSHEKAHTNLTVDAIIITNAVNLSLYAHF